MWDRALVWNRFTLQPDGYYVIDALLRTQLKPFFAGASKKLDSVIDEMFKPLVPSFGLAYVDFLPLEFGLGLCNESGLSDTLFTDVEGVA